MTEKSITRWGNNQTVADSMQEKRKEVLGDNLAAIYIELQKLFILTQAKWKQYRQLFNDNEAVAIQQKIAPMFFSLAGCVFFDDVVLSLSKITGSKTSGPRNKKQENCTLQIFQETPSPFCDDATYQELLNIVITKSKCLTDRRNKYISHYDLGQIINHDFDISIEEATIDDLIQSIFELFKYSEHKYFRFAVFPGVVLPKDSLDLNIFLKAKSI